MQQGRDVCLLRVWRLVQSGSFLLRGALQPGNDGRRDIVTVKGLTTRSTRWQSRKERVLLFAGAVPASKHHSGEPVWVTLIREELARMRSAKCGNSKGEIKESGSTRDQHFSAAWVELSQLAAAVRPQINHIELIRLFSTCAESPGLSIEYRGCAGSRCYHRIQLDTRHGTHQFTRFSMFQTITNLSVATRAKSLEGRA